MASTSAQSLSHEGFDLDRAARSPRRWLTTDTGLEQAVFRACRHANCP